MAEHRRSDPRRRRPSRSTGSRYAYPAAALPRPTYWAAYATPSRAGARATSRWSSPPGSSSLLAGRSASRQVDPAARRLRPGPALPRRRDRGQRQRRRPRRDRRPARASWPPWSATSPRTPRPRSSRPRSRPRSSCRWRCAATPPASRARAVEEVALALAIPHLLDRTVDTLSGGELQRVALAAALVTRPQPRPPRRAHLPARPRRRRRADLAPAPPQRGVGGGDPPRRTPPRALPGRRRPGHRDGRGRDRLRRLPERLPRLGPGRRPGPETPAARLFSLAGIEPSARRRPRRPPAILASREQLERGRRGSARAACFSQPPTRPAEDAPREKPSERGTPDLAARPPAEARDLWVELDASDELRATSCAGIDLTVDRGERVALMGRNGAGKSTLLRTAAGLVEPVRGKLERPAGSPC